MFIFDLEITTYVLIWMDGMCFCVFNLLDKQTRSGNVHYSKAMQSICLPEFWLMIHFDVVNALTCAKITSISWVYSGICQIRFFCQEIYGFLVTYIHPLFPSDSSKVFLWCRLGFVENLIALSKLPNNEIKNKYQEEQPRAGYETKPNFCTWPLQNVCWLILNARTLHFHPAFFDVNNIVKLLRFSWASLQV